jgi:P27 family predicted phage terminase small subunit
MRGSALTSSRDEIPHSEGDCLCPEWLGELGREKWEQMLPLLEDVPGLMKPAYVDHLALYCEAYEEFRLSRDEIKEHGAIATTQTGACYQHPNVGRKNKAIQRMRQFGALFGLSPADATRVNPGDKGSGNVDDPMSALLNAGAA